MASRRRRVLITGANGYIAAQTVARFLAAGWAVRGTVRDLDSGSARELAAHFAAERAAGDFELVVVRDIKAAGAFDGAVRGVQAIAHLATPVVFDSGDVEYIVGTAVEGTLSILESALTAVRKGAAEEEEKGITSFVLMSSVAAVRMQIPGPATFTEKDWNTRAEADVKEAGDKAFGHVIYAASKVASERAFWDWVKEKEPPFAASALNPWYVPTYRPPWLSLSAQPPLHPMLVASELHLLTKRRSRVIVGWPALRCTCRPRPRASRRQTRSSGRCFRAKTSPKARPGMGRTSTFATWRA